MNSNSMFDSFLMNYSFLGMLGDNGQGDVRTAELVYRDTQFNKNLQRVYIHQIQPRHVTYCKDPALTLHDSRMCYFGTYIDAAIDAYRHKLIRASGLRKIMEESCRDFLYIPVQAWLPHKASSSSSGGVKSVGAAGGVGGAEGGSTGGGAAGTPGRGRSHSLGSADGPLPPPSAAGVVPAGSPSPSPAPKGHRATTTATITTTFTTTTTTTTTSAAVGAPPGSPASSTGSRKQHPNTSTVLHLNKIDSSLLTSTNSSSAKKLQLAGEKKTASSSSSTTVTTSTSTSSTIPLLTRSFIGKQQSLYNRKKLRTGELSGEGLTAASMGFCRGGGLVKVFSSAAKEV